MKLSLIYKGYFLKDQIPIVSNSLKRRQDQIHNFGKFHEQKLHIMKIVSLNI